MGNTMYEEVRKTHNPFVGCRHACIYCVPSFQRQAKRQRKRCVKCYNYEPHFHPERLKDYLPRTKPDEFIFLCDMGDVAFAKPEWLKLIIEHEVRRYPDRTFLIQSKNPACFEPFSGLYPENLILGVTIETNKVEFDTPSKYRNYQERSKAPLPEQRYKAMVKLNHSRKLVTIEPILDFDLPILVSWIREIKPEAVYVGYDNHNCKLPEPLKWKTLKLIEELKKFTEVRRKTIRKAWFEW